MISPIKGVFQIILGKSSNPVTNILTILDIIMALLGLCGEYSLSKNGVEV